MKAMKPAIVEVNTENIVCVIKDEIVNKKL